MAITRLIKGQHSPNADSCIDGRNPMGYSEQDEPGIYLGGNPLNPALGLFLTFDEAVQIAHVLGYPAPEVYEAQRDEIFQLQRDVAELERQLNEDINTEQLKAVTTAIANSKKDILNAVEGYSGAVRARLDAVGKAAGASPVRPVAGKGKPVL